MVMDDCYHLGTIESLNVGVRAAEPFNTSE